jgi:tRNA pseudouridine38-40 synthase
VRGVNAFLPPSIGVRWAKVLEGDPAEENFFHARFSARARTYHYVLYNHQVRSSLLNGRAGFYHHALDVERMQEAVSR